MSMKRTRPDGYYSSWEPVAQWYDGWMGDAGSDHHQLLAIPAVMDLLAIQPGEQILDIGAGQGVLAPHVAGTQAHYTGVDASVHLLRLARKRHGSCGQFVVGDARRLQHVAGIRQGKFDAAVFLLSIQDMNPLEAVLESVAWALRRGGRVAILMTHPCFRIPRQSGWGWQAERRLQYRRIDRYLTPLSVPMKAHAERERGTTISFHRPLQTYINTLASNGLLVDAMKEVSAPQFGKIPSERSSRVKAEQTASQEIPLFLGLRAIKLVEAVNKT